MNKSKYNFAVILLVTLLFGLLLYYFNDNRSDLNTKCINEEKKYGCWRDSLLSTLSDRGLSDSYDLLANFYNTDPEFVSECHGFTHEMGEQAYNIYKYNKKIDLTPKTSYCGYGFYHGFMEALLQTNGNIKEAEDFCSYADKQLLQFNKKTNVACYHGIGHGAVDGSGETVWENSQEFISSALKICKAVSSSSEQIYQCGTGVFNSLAIALNSDSFNLNFSGNPYLICKNQEKNFKRACYEQMNTRVASISTLDLAKGVKLVSEIPERAYAVYAMEQLAPATISGRVGKNSDFSYEIGVCKSLLNHLSKPCIEGLVGGILEFGKPDFEYVEAMGLCSKVGENEYKDHCMKYVISSLRILYSDEKITEICSNLEGRYSAYCSNS